MRESFNYIWHIPNWTCYSVQCDYDPYNVAHIYTNFPFCSTKFIIQDIYHQLIFIQISTRPILKNENTLKIPQGSAIRVFFLIFSYFFLLLLIRANITHLLQFHVIHVTQSDVRIDREHKKKKFIGCIGKRSEAAAPVKLCQCGHF